MAPTASCTAEIAWEAFQYGANWSGEVCTCSWVLVQAASGRMESAVVSSRSTPLMEILMSSPRASRICSLSNRYRGFPLMLSRPMWPSARVGRMPIITRWAPTEADFCSASLRLRRRFSSKVSRPPDRSRAGGTLISMLN